MGVQQMKTGKEENQAARANALRRAKRWLEMRKQTENQCQCAQCLYVVQRQAVINAITGYSVGFQKSLFDSLN